MKRLLTAIVAIPILLYAIWTDTPYLFNTIAVVALVGATHELFRMAERVHAPPFWTIGYLAALVFSATPMLGRMDLNQGAFALLGIVLTLAVLARVGDKKRVLASAGVTAFGVVYTAYLGSYLVAIRMLAKPQVPGKLLTLFFAIIMLGDAGAYYTGRMLGRNKLAPKVSPGKTIEGSVGGLIASILGAVASTFIFFKELPIGDAVALGALLNVVGQAGDLSESLFKRGSNVKDSSSIIPGHGGFLDRLDSVLPNAPILYYYYVLILAKKM